MLFSIPLESYLDRRSLFVFLKCVYVIHQFAFLTINSNAVSHMILTYINSKKFWQGYAEFIKARNRFDIESL